MHESKSPQMYVFVTSCCILSGGFKIHRSNSSYQSLTDVSISSPYNPSPVTCFLSACSSLCQRLCVPTFIDETTGCLWSQGSPLQSDRLKKSSFDVAEVRDCLSQRELSPYSRQQQQGDTRLHQNRGTQSSVKYHCQTHRQGLVVLFWSSCVAASITNCDSKITWSTSQVSFFCLTARMLKPAIADFFWQLGDSGNKLRTQN